MIRSMCLPAILVVAALAGCGDTVPAEEFEPSPIPTDPVDVIAPPKPPQTMAVGSPRDQVPVATTINAQDCGANKLAGFVGQNADAGTRTAIAASAGHGNIRWLTPDAEMTDDLQPERLNVLIDRHGRIIRYRCG